MMTKRLEVSSEQVLDVMGEWERIIKRLVDAGRKGME
jgi:hypothetical protein